MVLGQLDPLRVAAGEKQLGFWHGSQWTYMAKTEEYLSQIKYAEYRNVAKGYISRMVKEGRLHLIKGKLNVEISDAELDNKSNNNKAPNYWSEKALHEKAKRELAELDLKLKQDQLVEVDQVGLHLDLIFSAVWQRLLATPSKIAPLVHAEESVGGARIVLESAVFEVLDELSEYVPVEQMTAKVNRTTKTTTKANYKRVGCSWKRWFCFIHI